MLSSLEQQHQGGGCGQNRVSCGEGLEVGRPIGWVTRGPIVPRKEYGLYTLSTGEPWEAFDRWADFNTFLLHCHDAEGILGLCLTNK